MTTCRVFKGREVCGNPARYRVVFKDDDRAPVCEGCALDLQQIAQNHGTMVKVEPLELESA
jgi:hypothetical protein